MAEPQQATPHVEGFKLLAERNGSQEEITSSLSSISALELAPDGDDLVALYVESRDIRRNPYLFTTIYLRKSDIECVYTVPPSASSRLRKLEALRLLLNLLTIIQNSYRIDMRMLFQILQESLKEFSEFASPEQKELFAKFDQSSRERDELETRADELSKANDRLGKELIDARASIEEMSLRLQRLEAYSDEILMAKIQDWLESHHNEINLVEFSKQHNVAETRVEEVLNKMVTGGYLEVVG